MNKFKTLHVTF